MNLYSSTYKSTSPTAWLSCQWFVGMYWFWYGLNKSNWRHNLQCSYQNVWMVGRWSRYAYFWTLKVHELYFQKDSNFYNSKWCSTLNLSLPSENRKCCIENVCLEVVCGKMCKQQKIQFKLTLIFTWIMFFYAYRYSSSFSKNVGLVLLWNGWIHRYMHIFIRYMCTDTMIIHIHSAHQNRSPFRAFIRRMGSGEVIWKKKTLFLYQYKVSRTCALTFHII